jgi:hypothetical protein
MTVTVAWDDEAKTILRYEFTDPWTWDEFFAVLDADDDLIGSVEHTVHVIFDATGMRFVPPNPVAQFKNVASLINPRLGILVIVGNNLWFQKVGEIFHVLYGRRVQGISKVLSTQTLDEARALIAEHQHEA